MTFPSAAVLAPIITLMARRPHPEREADPETERPEQHRTPQQVFDEWWPIVARIGGFGLAFVHVMVSQLFGAGDIDPAVLTFCGTLVLLSAGGGRKGSDD